MSWSLCGSKVQSPMKTAVSNYRCETILTLVQFSSKVVGVVVVVVTVVMIMVMVSGGGGGDGESSSWGGDGGGSSCGNVSDWRLC